MLPSLRVGDFHTLPWWQDGLASTLLTHPYTLTMHLYTQGADAKADGKTLRQDADAKLAG